MTKKLFSYLWIVSLLYLLLGFFNIIFAWLGLLCFFIPLIISLIKGNKSYCHTYCGRGQLFHILGTKYKLSRNKTMSRFLISKWFRYGFLIFFLTMFMNMLWITYLVFNETNSMKEFITLFWTFRLPWHFAYPTTVTPWIAQFAFGFYSMMLTSTLLGLVSMVLYKPRSWCVYCPMGSMTQLICQIRKTKDAF